jgi:predicted amidohydrolase
VDLVRIALAHVRIPSTPDESVALSLQAIDQATCQGARIICFPECFIPGYRRLGKPMPLPNSEFLERAWSIIADAATKANITVVLGTECFVDGALIATGLLAARCRTSV